MPGIDKTFLIRWGCCFSILLATKIWIEILIGRQWHIPSVNSLRAGSRRGQKISASAKQKSSESETVGAGTLRSSLPGAYV